MTRVIYICRGNIGRSIAAKIITEELSKGKVIADSAGLVETKYPDMSSNMRRVLTKMGYHPGRHRPKKATAQIFEGAQHALCFEHYQVEAIAEISPGIESIVSTLPQYGANSNKEITDPTDIITEIQGYNIVGKMPFMIRSALYRASGVVDPRDEEGVFWVYQRTARTIEFYVREALKKLI